ncbi:MAG: hypothetical protein O2780_07160, partial [Proteobacteria bacterium]|nr:hypothetical protein [Pseudomonadota bacterium]
MKKTSKKFSYCEKEGLDSVCDYVSTLCKGLQNRHLALGADDARVEFYLPDDVTMSLDAGSGKKGGSLVLKLVWRERAVIPADDEISGKDSPDEQGKQGDKDEKDEKDKKGKKGKKDKKSKKGKKDKK